MEDKNEKPMSKEGKHGLQTTEDNQGIVEMKKAKQEEEKQDNNVDSKEGVP